MTLRAAGTYQELTHKMDRYRWNIRGLRWKNFGQKKTEEGHKVFFSGKMINTSMALGFLFTKTS